MLAYIYWSLAVHAVARGHPRYGRISCLSGFKIRLDLISVIPHYPGRCRHAALLDEATTVGRSNQPLAQSVTADESAKAAVEMQFCRAIAKIRGIMVPF